jgi:hypothetical protein
MTDKIEQEMTQQTKKIETITDAQKAKMPEYVEKWVKVGTNTDRLDPVRSRKTIDNFRRALLNMNTDVPLIILDNPLECWAACALVLHYNVAPENIEAEIKDVFNGNPKKYEIPRASLPWQTGSFFVSTFAFYDYMIEELGVEIPADLYAKYKIWEATSALGCIYPLENVTFVSQKPTVIKQIKNGETYVLHCEDGPALEYAGYGNIKEYCLNGVRVPEHIVMTPAEQLDLDYYNTITNADVKAEFVRKVGIERFKSKGKLVDTYEKYKGEEYEWWHKSQYELWDMSALFDGLSYAPFLSMSNQTVPGVFHFEGVSPQCTNLKEAIRERLGGNDMVIRSIA